MPDDVLAITYRGRTVLVRKMDTPPRPPYASAPIRVVDFEPRDLHLALSPRLGLQRVCYRAMSHAALRVTTGRCSGPAHSVLCWISDVEEVLDGS